MQQVGEAKYGAAAGKARLEMRDNGVAVVRLGAAEEPVVVFTAARLRSLHEIVSYLQANKPAGVVFLASAPEMFTVGADINVIQSLTDAAQAEALAREGQALCDEVAALPCPTVAAISGICVGAGCELALACRYRLISSHKSSLIGLPEIKLGILPAFGGTQRLPRLIGLPRALDLILKGRLLKPSEADLAGLVDEVTAYEMLLPRAEEVILGTAKIKAKRMTLMERLLTYVKPGRSLVARQVQKRLLEKSKGLYPAPLAALQSVVAGLNEGAPAGLKREARELGRLIVGPEAKNLSRLFFLAEAAKAIGKPARQKVEELQAVVAGSGPMGAGIAAALARSGAAVILKDQTDEALTRGLSEIKKTVDQLDYLTETERSFIINRIEPTTRDSANLGNVNFAIEAVSEILGAKQRVLVDLSILLPPDAILATNTSALSVTKIASVISHPERVIGMHFFNPVEKMQVVEIVRGAKTSDKTLITAAALATKLGKYPIVVKDVPGFLLNRILTPFLSEAARLLNEGYALTDIDQAALVFGFSMAPFRRLDEMGLELAQHLESTLQAAYGERMQGPGYLKRFIDKGRKGRSTGAGFYDYRDGKASVSAETSRLLGAAPRVRTGADTGLLQMRLLLCMINEAVHCLDEGVAGRPGREAASQIDLGSVLALGFPPVLGGLLAYAQGMGARLVYEKLCGLEKSAGKQFAPASGIQRRAEAGVGFYEAV